jgi:hypothetical protein
MKKLLAILLAAAMILSFAACGNDDDNPASGGGTTVTTDATAPATTDGDGSGTTPGEIECEECDDEGCEECEVPGGNGGGESGEFSIDLPEEWEGGDFLGTFMATRGEDAMIMVMEMSLEEMIGESEIDLTDLTDETIDALMEEFAEEGAELISHEKKNINGFEALRIVTEVEGEQVLMYIIFAGYDVYIAVYAPMSEEDFSDEFDAIMATFTVE